MIFAKTTYGVSQHQNYLELLMIRDDQNLTIHLLDVAIEDKAKHAPPTYMSGKISL